MRRPDPSEVTSDTAVIENPIMRRPSSEDDDRAFEEIVRQLREGDPATIAAVKGELAKLTLPRRMTGGMPSGWYIIRVELESGRGEDYKPPPGRDLLVSPNHTFRQLAELINACFARWDLGHLYVFRMEDGTNIGFPDEDLGHVDPARRKLGVRREDEVFEYEFDFGDGWTHRCTVLEVDVTPEDHYGVRPKGSVAVWGWGSMPDQYGRTRPDGEDEEDEEDEEDH
jgi:hypothetical protein